MTTWLNFDGKLLSQCRLAMFPLNFNVPVLEELAVLGSAHGICVTLHNDADMQGLMKM